MERNQVEVECALKLHKLVFDKIHFDRKGFKNDKDISWAIQIQIGQEAESHIHKATICLQGNKEEEYELEVQVTGFFSVDGEDDLSKSLVKNNTVAILMPYIRSQISLITAQPETECVVLPPININAIMNEEN